ncbi:hypothetical protein M2349_002435 [Caldanaerobacter subterraneus subsp. tengcongensis MB4]|uniref:Uncharacterized protein n=2 Tax=Caldanaerobacter subterraneus TaxID=911092 RepID=Q8R6S0_CALS4|nr:hypothetical protein [Caldanaerobacter subterraneus]AAM25834.1 hypothetical protein TTE2717 [Caldanaerobacter subterraneus subsp. tengcongensis MB4]KKC28533.1 hypothetical protein CDSM653_02451 [Caldanaerobacter subterraneus subsp. pacificus DSM 12653]MCS3917294.1 hypothetical protein [Caldanaerobacter subterraneus subsp. tengcongensis MB4]HHW57299.1 hypothetical protein [Clostridia bacterium]
MNNREDLLKKYKHKITPGEKSIEELIDFLKQKVDIKEISTTDLPESIMKHIILNAVHCLRNQRLNLTAREFNFIAYKLFKNDKSNLYYQSNYAHISNNEKEDIIYVVFETKTGCIHSNCNRLLLELFIEQGISEFDYKNETPMFYAYLGYLDAYNNGEY